MVRLCPICNYFSREVCIMVFISLCNMLARPASHVRRLRSVETVCILPLSCMRSGQGGTAQSEADHWLGSGRRACSVGVYSGFAHAYVVVLKFNIPMVYSESEMRCHGAMDNCLRENARLPCTTRYDFRPVRPSFFDCLPTVLAHQHPELQ